MPIQGNSEINSITARMLIERIQQVNQPYTIREVDDKGYLIEHQNEGGLVFISFAKSFNLTKEQETRLAIEFRDLLIKRLNLDPGESVGTI